MTATSVRQLLVVNLSGIYQAEEEFLRQLPLLSARAFDPALGELFDSHYRDTQRQVGRLTTVFELLDERRRGSLVPAVRGLVEEARLREAFLERGDLLDLALIDTGRRIEHYELAAYTSVLAYARRLGHTEVAALLIETLEEERRADNRLEELMASTRMSTA